MTSPTPPPRRRPVPAQQPARRPKVAGLRRPQQRPDEQHPERPTNANDETQVIPKIPATPTEESTPRPTPRRKAKQAPESVPPSVRDEPRPAKAADVEDDSFTGTFAPTMDAAAIDDTVEAPPGTYSILDDLDQQDRRSRMRVPVILAVVAVLIGGLAAWFGVEWTNARSTSSASNTALSDVGTTSQVNGQITNAVNQTFSFDYTNLGKTSNAVQQVLTGTALCQYNEIFKQVRQQAPSQKLVLTTTVQKEGVELLQGDTARVLLLVNQHVTRATTNQTTDSQSMIAVNTIKQGGTWKISAIDTFNGPDNTTNCK